MTQLQAVRKFAAEVAEQKVIIARQRLHNNWAMCIRMFDTELRMMVPTNFNYEADESDRAFRKDFIARYAPHKVSLMPRFPFFTKSGMKKPNGTVMVVYFSIMTGVSTLSHKKNI